MTPFELAARCKNEPIVSDGVLPALCPQLAEVILERSRRTRSLASLNVGGWKSGEDVFAWPDAAVQELRQHVVEATGCPRPVAWAMVNRAGSHHPRHQHRAAIVTGVYYVAPGDPVTPTIFERPDRTELEVSPAPGRLAIFRGETWHRVPPYAGDAPRITIAFDVRR